MKYLFLLLIVFASLHSFAQVDTNYLKNLYDHCIDLNEDKKDSLKIYTDFIEQHSKLLGFEKGKVFSSRLKGIYEELSANYDDALSHYLVSLSEARRLKSLEYEISALSDLAILYYNLKEPYESKRFYLQVVELVKKKGEIGTMVGTYTNLGVVYMRLNMYDSAEYYLDQGYRIGKPYEERLDLSTLYNNLGNVAFNKKEFDKALVFFRDNLVRHEVQGNIAGYWTDNLNIGDVYVEQKKFDSAQFYAARALRLSEQLESKSKQADSYALLSRLAEGKGDFKDAHDKLKKWYTLDTSVLNGDTYQTVAQLQERFNAKEREIQNQSLQFEIKTQKLWSRGLIIVVVALTLTGVLAFVAFITKRNANKKLSATNVLMNKQNKKLAELNYEKKSLIGIVSHDLSTPFATIQMWGQILQGANGSLDEEQQKAVNRILQASKYGDNLINRILDIEKTDIVDHRIEFTDFDIVNTAKEVVENFMVQATVKELKFHTEYPPNPVMLFSDEQLVQRILSNLVSNAIKYTHKGKEIWVTIRDESDSVRIIVSDEGIGIQSAELPFLFSRYNKLSSKPTDGEHSTGLGLSIVKRIVEELNGSIDCESEPGRGSVFTVILGK
ncbi:MAG: sensor histidine kinase [Chitinophagaceae bacterium]|nr:MAG: sensor histidine kinase [Chitinophagaceae bacterium]